MWYNYKNSGDQRFNQLAVSEKYGDATQGTLDGRALQEDQIVNNYDARLMQYIVNLHNALRDDKISVSKFQSAMEALRYYQDEYELEYLNALIHPESARGSKIPSQIPVPSTSFQLHNTVQFTPNSNGNAAIYFNPCYLNTNTGTARTTLYLNQHSSLTGSATNDNFNSLDIGLNIPGIYNSYRVVSASLVIRYVGRLDIVQGMIGGAVFFDPNLHAGSTTAGTKDTTLAQYGDFNFAMDSFYTQENYTLNGVRILYFPLDNSYEEYTNLGTEQKGFGMFAYILGGVPGGNYKLDIYVNYECLPNPSFLNYMPVSSCTKGMGTKSQAIAAAQQTAVTDADADKPKKQNNGFWNWLKENVGEFLPGIAKIASTFLPGGAGKILMGATNALVK